MELFQLNSDHVINCIFTEENKILYKGRRCAPCINLLNTFRKDLEKRKILNNLEC